MRRASLTSGVVGPLVAALILASTLLAPTSALATPPTTAIRYFYDAEGHIKAVYNPANETALYGWDAAGNLLSIARKSSSALSITELAPEQGAVGETITIDGTGFSTTTGNDTVKFNGTTATVSAATAWALTVKVPTGATTGTVTVKTTTEGPATSVQTFTVAASPAPHATSISPSVATVGTSVTVSGSNFEAAHVLNDGVEVNGMRAPVTSATSTALHISVPGATLGGHTTVTTPFGSTTGPDLYIPPEGLAASKVGPTGRLTVGGASTTLTFTAGEKVGLGIFDGTAGERVSVTATESTIASSVITLWSPSGAKLYETSLFSEMIFEPFTLPSTGTYTVMIRPYSVDTGKAKLSAYTVHDVTGTINPTVEGASTHVALETPGQNARYTVEVTAGEVVSLATSSSTFGGSPVPFEWLNSREEVVSNSESSTGTGEYLGATRFAAAGTYTLIVNPVGLYTGALTLTAYNASDAAGSLTLGEAKTFNIVAPGQLARITFPASSGEHLSVPITEPAFGIGSVALYDPEGSKVTEWGFNGEGFLEPLLLSKTGTYTLIVTPGLGRTGSFKLGAYSVHEVTGSITPTTEGTLKHVTLSTPGENARYSVEVTANEVVSLSTGESTFGGGSPVVFEWYKSSGELVSNNEDSTGTGEYLGATRFATAGTYTLIVNPQSLYTGSLGLTVYNASDATGTITPGGESVRATVGVPGQVAKLTFTGSEGQLLTLKAKESTFLDGWFTMQNPEGTQLAGSENNLSGEPRYEFTPATTGTYTIVVHGYLNVTGSVSLTLYTGSHDNIVRASKAAADDQLLHTAADGAAPHKADVQLNRSLASWQGQPFKKPAVTAAPLVGRQAPRLLTPHRSTASRPIGGSPMHDPHSTGPTLAQASPQLAVTEQMRAYRPLRLSAWAPTRGSSGRVDWLSLQPATPWSGIAPLHAAADVTALTGQVLGLDGLPLQGVSVAVEGTYVSAQTDSTGRFLLSGLPAGHQVLVIEGEAVPGHTRYGNYEVGVGLTAGHTTTLEQTVWLTPLEREGDHRIASPTTRGVSLTTPQIPGLEVRIPAGTVITDPAGHRVRKLNITAIPIDRPPFSLPPFIEVPIYFTVQPGRAYLSKPAQIIYPNYTHLPAGQRVPFWNYDPDSRGWYIYGYGTVTPNDKQVVPDKGVGVWQFSGAMISGSPTPPTSGPKGASGGGDPVDLYTGLFNYHKTDLVLPDTIPIVIQRSYRQADSNSYSFSVGTTSLYDLRLWSNNNFHEADLVLPEGGRVHYVRTSPGEGSSEAEYKSTNTPGVYYDSILKWDQSVPGWDLTLTNGITYVFGELAPLQAIRDRFGDELKITRSEGLHGNITQITSPHGRWVTFTYDGNNRITEIKDNGGRTLKYAYNSSGLLEKVTDAAERVTKYEYDSSGNMTMVTDGRGTKYLENKYDANDRVSKQIDADGGTFEFGYSLNGESKVESATITDPRENKQKVTFNSEGYSTSETLGLSTSLEEGTQIERQAGTGLILSTTDPLSRKTAYEYDAYGNTTSVTNLAGTASAQKTKYSYEPGTNELTKRTDPLNHSTSYEYGPKGELLTVTDPLGHKTTYEYNASGQPTVIKNALGKSTTLAYTFGDLTSVTDPLNRTTKQFVDGIGRTISTVQPAGQRTIYGYGADSELTSTTGAASAVTSMEYDGDGNMTSITDPRHNKTVEKYDSLDRLESVTDPLEHAATVVHDKNGNITQVTDRNGKVNKYVYDALNRMTEAKIGVSGEAAERTFTYTYDKGNRLTKIVDSATGTYTPEYDELNRLKSIATPAGTVSYEYDEANRRKSMTAPGQEALKYTYDEANRLTELKRGTQKVTLAYDAGNRLTKTTLPDSIEEQYGYDNANELTSIVDKKGASTLGELDYSYEADGRREALWGSYGRTGLPEAFSSATYNADNEQTERAGKTLGYDADGNLTSEGTSTYKWNPLGELTEITGGTTASFTYDPFGRRISKTLGTTTTKTLYDGVNPVQETQGTSTTNLFTSLSPDSILARTTSTATQSYLTDALGSTIALASSAGNVETSYTYDPFGATTHEGTASTNPFQYASRENDEDGLYDNRARYYSPTAARFISQDPTGLAGSGPDLYLYTNDSPTNFTDPMGTNLQPALPGFVSSPGGNTPPGGSGSSPGTSPPPPGGIFSPSAPTGCTPGPIAKGSSLSEGPGLFQAVQCRNYTRLEQVESENKSEQQEEEEREERGNFPPCKTAELTAGGLGVAYGGASIASAPVPPISGAFFMAGGVAELTSGAFDAAHQITGC